MQTRDKEHDQMTRRYKSATAVVLGMLVLSMVAAASASAHEFVVAGHAVTSPEAVTGAAPAGSPARIETTFGTTHLVTECGAFAYSGKLEAGGKASGEVKFSSCKLVGQPHCSVPVTLFPTINSLLPYRSSLGVEFASIGTEQLFNLTWNGAECVFKGTRFVVGHPACELVAAEKELVEHELVCKTPESNIEVSKNPGAIVAVEKLKLASGKAWSAR
jgi:hypothetical protein